MNKNVKKRLTANREKGKSNLKKNEIISKNPKENQKEKINDKNEKVNNKNEKINDNNEKIKKEENKIDNKEEEKKVELPTNKINKIELRKR